MRLLSFLVLILLAGCSSAPIGVVSAPVPVEVGTPAAVPVEPSTPPVTPSATPVKPSAVKPTPAPKRPPVDVAGAVRGVQKSATVGALVIDRQTGAELVSVNPDRRFHSASLVKLLIALDVLHSGGGDRDRVRRMLQMSDDPIASELWTRAGGVAMITRTAKRLGLTHTRPPTDPGRWGDTLLSPRDVARIYTHVLTELPAADQALVVDALATAPRVAADGFDQHFGIPTGVDADWAVKQGWGDNAKVDFVHSTGLVGAKWRYIVVLLTEHPPSTRLATAASSVTAGAKAVNRVVSENEG
ncbi:hypothetical protein SAMN05192558_11498 [Actinokineospora alba]|uniref:Beta-lactamase class A catalytic domain-containing protein n=1 Tax=Actinokineospora alba TaxID=504798 RepID=A0A1H0VKU2_9PSEU|nr:serine hydrolase [Actinokineospora alba]TDP67665.1 hypothetical protein C8E96_3211 [Actinokineospora alba]SDJ28876.1 hypothetical protein SAMN05421871_11298 [Actinokineospora alba]SDP78828.1 hypothetical protein SAMN05192558_11498 [Actinokineospora alba]